MRLAPRFRDVGAVLLLGGLAGFLSGCVYSAVPEVKPPHSGNAVAETSPYIEDLVLVVFALEAEFGDDRTLEQMWEVEDRAAAALETSGAGYIDGNEIGAAEYALYFYGADREAMWQVLEPIMRDAPIPLTRVELWPPGESAEPTVIEFPAEVRK